MSRKLRRLMVVGVLAGIPTGYAISASADESTRPAAGDEHPTVSVADRTRPDGRRQVTVGEVITVATRIQGTDRCEIDKEIGLEVRVPPGLSESLKSIRVVWGFNESCEAIFEELVEEAAT